LRFSLELDSFTHDRSYLYRTAHNLAVDHVRQQARQKTEATPEDEIAKIADHRPSQEEEVDARLRLDRLRIIVSELPENTREIFVLNRIDGLSYSETADRVGMSESSVQKHLAKALLHVTRRLKPQ
jgi:RNA polymerase sigma factor (sigma-70 family)